MKYKVLLVDDENIYLQYLSRIIDWEELQCGICGFAKERGGGACPYPGKAS